MRRKPCAVHRSPEAVRRKLCAGSREPEVVRRTAPQRQSLGPPCRSGRRAARAAVPLGPPCRSGRRAARAAVSLGPPCRSGRRAVLAAVALVASGRPASRRRSVSRRGGRAPTATGVGAAPAREGERGPLPSQLWGGCGRARQRAAVGAHRAGEVILPSLLNVRLPGHGMSKSTFPFHFSHPPDHAGSYG